MCPVRSAVWVNGGHETGAISNFCLRLPLNPSPNKKAQPAQGSLILEFMFYKNEIRDFTAVPRGVIETVVIENARS